MKKIRPLFIFDGLYSGQGGGGSANKSKVRNLASSLITILFLVSIILQTASVRNPYAQRNLLSDKEKNRKKEKAEQLQLNGNFTEATAAEISHDLVCTFIEVSAVLPILL